MAAAAVYTAAVAALWLTSLPAKSEPASPVSDLLELAALLAVSIAAGYLAETNWLVFVPWMTAVAVSMYAAATQASLPDGMSPFWFVVVDGAVPGAMVSGVVAIGLAVSLGRRKSSVGGRETRGHA